MTTHLPAVALVAQTIQLAIAPVFLLAGIGAFLNVTTGRLARVIDRARKIEQLVLTTTGREHDRHVWEIKRLDRRMTIVNWSIGLAAASGMAVALVVVSLFLAELLHVNLGTLIALLFIGAMLLVVAALALFLIEVHLAARTIRVRDEVLFHEVEAAGAD